MENIALFMHNCDITSEINKQLIKTPLQLFALEDNVYLCNHLQVVLLKELKIEGARIGGGSSLAHGAQGLVHLEGLRQ